MKTIGNTMATTYEETLMDGSVISGSGYTNTISVSAAREGIILVELTEKNGPTPAILFIAETQASDGEWYELNDFDDIMLADPAIPTRAAYGISNFGRALRLRYSVMGANEPTFAGKILIMLRP